MKLLNESIADLLKEIKQEAEDAKFNKPGTTTRGGTDNPDDFCDECKLLGFCKNRYPERFEAHKKETLNKTNSMKKLYFTLLIISTAIFCSAQTTTYTDQYGNVIGTSTTTGGNDIFGGSAVRSPSPPVAPISDDALRAGYAAREANQKVLIQSRHDNLWKWSGHLIDLDEEFLKCYPQYACSNRNCSTQWLKIINGVDIDNLTNGQLLSDDSYYNIIDYFKKWETYYIDNINSCHNR